VKLLPLPINGRSWLIAAGVSVLVIALLLVFVMTSPPRKIVIAAGPEGSYFDLTAKRYAAELKAQGMKTEIVHTAGAMDNLKLINTPSKDIDFAFIHGGLTDTAASPQLMSLGSIGYEPVWVFYRSKVGLLARLNDLRGRRISVGVAGSGVQIISEKFLGAVGIDTVNTQVAHLNDAQVREGLINGTLDAAFVMDPPESPRIHALFDLPGVQVLALSQAEALRRNFPFLHVRTLPRGAADLKLDRPSQDLNVSATTAMVVARKNTNSAVVYLLMSILDKVHQTPTLLNNESEFPADRDVDLPLAPQAERYYQGGKPFLQRYLPFWVASVVERLLAILLPLAALVIPLMNILPRIYNWRIQLKITRCYRDLIELERGLKNLTPEQSQAEFDRLARMVDEYLDARKVPVSHSNQIYVLKEHIELVRRQMSR
jgi:TRAP transporter TAXI family solute receptor